MHRWRLKLNNQLLLVYSFHARLLLDVPGILVKYASVKPSRRGVGITFPSRVEQQHHLIHCHAPISLVSHLVGGKRQSEQDIPGFGEVEENQDEVHGNNGNVDTIARHMLVFSLLSP